MGQLSSGWPKGACCRLMERSLKRGLVLKSLLQLFQDFTHWPLDGGSAVHLNQNKYCSQLTRVIRTSLKKVIVTHLASGRAPWPSRVWLNLS